MVALAEPALGEGEQRLRCLQVVEASGGEREPGGLTHLPAGSALDAAEHIALEPYGAVHEFEGE
jgi:hypothetical protein